MIQGLLFITNEENQPYNPNEAYHQSSIYVNNTARVNTGPPPHRPHQAEITSDLTFGHCY